MTTKLRLMGAWIIVLAVILTCFPAYTSASSQEAGTYSADYLVLRAEDDSASIANDYWEKPATVTVAGDGAMVVRMTINHSKWVKEFSVPTAGGSSYTAVKVVSSDETADKRTVEFRAEDLAKPISAKIHVIVEDIGYDHKYTIRFSFDTNSFKLIKAAEKPAVKPAEKPSEEKPASTEKPVDDSKEEPSSSPAATPKPSKQENVSKGSAETATGSGKVSTGATEPTGTVTPQEDDGSASESMAATGQEASTEPPDPSASVEPEGDTELDASANMTANSGEVSATAGEEDAAAVMAPPSEQEPSLASGNKRDLKGIYILGAFILAGAAMAFIQRRKRQAKR
ncbi:heme uptake protein IsdC [Paenibacillus glycanilyticus]|uniref:NEAT domain-containing protein n=1 Tax=Paenibacillus glycanilyticus TaxID=126569 RepID=A0ABQ6GGZ4_9BACL|nr:heme uptake protein IsdC [Paenibacillus glycanilyticus]GLX70219.1 hypothetical protein MU1_45650 [Paenibacillus glycanilyticus]